MITVEYTCSDGTPFPVEFASAEQAAQQWTAEREHMPEPVPPLSLALTRMGTAGDDRAYEEAGLVMPAWFLPGPAPFGFTYFSNAPLDPDAMTKLFTGCAELVRVHGSGLAVWRDRCLPRVEEICEWFRSDAAAAAPLTRLAEAASEGFHLTMIPAYIVGNDIDQLAKALPFGEESLLAAYELTQGYASDTLDANQALWDLGQAAAASPAILHALGAPDVVSAMGALRANGDQGTFFAAVDEFLAHHGRRAEAWDIGYPTWAEQGPGLWASVRRAASGAGVEPREALAQGARRREELVADIEGRLAGDDEALGRFRRRLERAAPYVAVREERAKWQLILVGDLRHALLARGRALVASGVVDRPDDVLYLLPDEIEGAEGDLREVVAARRREHERWRPVTPPAVIGGDSDRVVAAPEEPRDGVVRGVGASRGVATGRARVVLDLDGADDFEPGDVLVCVMTSPPWTPLFALAAAVVADAGDRGGHTAIAAREYGIPAVLGTGSGTKLIPDGAPVRVDGTAGTVDILS